MSSGGDRLLPLEALDAAEAASIDGLLFDVDDTVTRAGKLETAALDALHRLGDAGILRVAITGRPIGWAETIAHQWPVDVAVGENGAGWVRVAEGGVREGYALDEAARAEARRALDALVARAAVLVPDVPRSGDHASRRCDLAFDVGEHARPPEASIARLAAIVREAGFDVLRSSVHLHVLPGRWDKATGARFAIESALGRAFDPARWAFVGDSGNDAAAFAAFPFSFGVANVREHLHLIPVPPRYVTCADRGLGFAELASALIAARGAARERA